MVNIATPAPESLCVLRLSAVGDVCHTLPVVRTLQAAWPETRITWIIGRLEASLVGDIPGIEFITFDKSKGLGAYTALRRTLRGRRFGLLLHMQMSLRASVAGFRFPSMCCRYVSSTTRMVFLSPASATAPICIRRLNASRAAR